MQEIHTPKYAYLLNLPAEDNIKINLILAYSICLSGWTTTFMEATFCYGLLQLKLHLMEDSKAHFSLTYPVW